MSVRRVPDGVGVARPRPASSSGGPSLDAGVASLAALDADALRLQWRNHLGGIPPAHLPRWLLARILAYRIQAVALGDLDKATLRIIRPSKGEDGGQFSNPPFAPRDPSTREGVGLKAGALLVREWNGRMERVMVLDKGFAWNGRSYGSLSQIAKAMTGTSWNGHRFFGLRPAGGTAVGKTSRGRAPANPKSNPVYVSPAAPDNALVGSPVRTAP